MSSFGMKYRTFSISVYLRTQGTESYLFRRMLYSAIDLLTYYYRGW